jgi:hypothetical protein
MSQILKNSDWTSWSGTDQQWNTAINEFAFSNIYQSAQWAHYKSAAGWSNLRLVRLDSEQKLVAVAQCLVKKGPLNSAVLWIPGGPIGSVECPASSLLKSIKEELKVSILYVRASFFNPTTNEDELMLKDLGWTRCRTSLGAQKSMDYLLDQPEEIRRVRCTTNWGRNLRRAEKNINRPYLWSHPDASEIASSYSEMNQFKDVTNLDLSRSESEISNIIDSFKDELLIIRCDDDRGNIDSLRGVLRFSNRAWDFLALTSPNGRKNYSSHAVFWHLTNVCQSLGVESIDLSGIDPENNKGVYDFKKGTGAQQIDYLGEWDVAQPRWMRPFLSRIIAK